MNTTLRARNHCEDEMPDRSKGEPLNKFIERYMGSKRARQDFPKPKQRLAVAYSEARERSKKRA